MVASGPVRFRRARTPRAGSRLRCSCVCSGPDPDNPQFEESLCSARRSGMLPRPPAYHAEPLRAPYRCALCDEAGKHLARERRQCRAPSGFHVFAVFQHEDVGTGSVVAPNLSDAQTGVDRELIERRAGDVYLDDQVRWRVHVQVYPGLAAYTLLVGDVEAGIGLETSFEIAASVSRRAHAISVDAHLFG